jgi:predicted HD superfamily hydrolase involved in NAD metabolism
MEDLLRDIRLTGRLAESVPRFLYAHGCAHTADHVRAVAAVSGRLAGCFDVDVAQAETGGWLHDISAVIPVASRVAFAERHGIPVLPEERRVPMILHQKLSALLARDVFGVEDEAVLSAIGCHTTLCRDATPLDKVVFLADKIAWDQAGRPPYLDELNRALENSLDAAICVYLQTLWDTRQALPVVHPWLADAHAQLCAPHHLRLKESSIAKKAQRK